MKLLNKIANAVDKLVEALSVVAILFVFAVIVIQVVVRKLGGTMSWADEICRYLTLLMIFFGAARSARSGDTIRVDVILERLNPTARKWIEVVMQAVILAFMCLFTYSLYLGIGTLGTQTLGILTSIRLSSIYWCIFAAMILLCVNTLLHMVDIIQNGMPEHDVTTAGVFDDPVDEEKEAQQ